MIVECLSVCVCVRERDRETETETETKTEKDGKSKDWLYREEEEIGELENGQPCSSLAWRPRTPSEAQSDGLRACQTSGRAGQACAEPLRVHDWPIGMRRERVRLSRRQQPITAAATIKEHQGRTKQQTIKRDKQDAMTAFSIKVIIDPWPHSPTHTHTHTHTHTPEKARDA